MSLERDKLIDYFERQIEFQRKLIELTQSVYLVPTRSKREFNKLAKLSVRFLKSFHALALHQQAEARTIITQLKENTAEPSIIARYQINSYLQQKHFNEIYKDQGSALMFEAVSNDILNFTNDPSTPPLKWEQWTLEDDWVWKNLLAKEGTRPSETLPSVDTSTENQNVTDPFEQLSEEDLKWLKEIQWDDLSVLDSSIPLSSDNTKNPPPRDTLTEASSKLPLSSSDSGRVTSSPSAEKKISSSLKPHLNYKRRTNRKISAEEKNLLNWQIEKLNPKLKTKTLSPHDLTILRRAHFLIDRHEKKARVMLTDEDLELFNTIKEQYISSSKPSVQTPANSSREQDHTRFFPDETTVQKRKRSSSNTQDEDNEELPEGKKKPEPPTTP